MFDCSLKYKGISLNDCLEKWPDLANSLVCVLLRFRLENSAVGGDSEKTFYQIRGRQKDFHRFLWYENNDITREPSIFCMKFHIFGAISSPSIANFTLKMCVERNVE